MKHAPTSSTTDALLAPLHEANERFNRVRPGDTGARQAVHTVYGGAHLFRHDSGRKLGELALRSLREYAPDFAVFARAVGLRGAGTLLESSAGAEAMRRAMEGDAGSFRESNPDAWLAATVYSRVVAKLEREPVEDFRIDFEDGYGARPDAEEDACAESAAGEVARGMAEKTLPPFIGIRIKPLSRELAGRAVRTLDIFLTSLAGQSGAKLPDNFVVTVPKVVIPEQVVAVVRALEAIEKSSGYAPGSLKVELMIETPQSIIDVEGRSNLPILVGAAEGRCVGAHFGVYDYTASLTITAEHQHMRHPACDIARSMMQVALAGSGVTLSDGATNVMPVPVHRASKDGPPLTASQAVENSRSVHRAWKIHFDDIRHSLENAYYQGWDLHPAQLPTRYAALYSFFLEGFESASDRLRNFVDKAAQATLLGDIFDDAATGQGLLNFFLRGMNCGAITEEEAGRTGLTREEFSLRSFARIVEKRSARAP